MGEGGKERSIAGRRCHKKVVGGPRIAEVDTWGQGGEETACQNWVGETEQTRHSLEQELLSCYWKEAGRPKKTGLPKLLAALLIGSWWP